MAKKIDQTADTPASKPATTKPASKTAAKTAEKPASKPKAAAKKKESSPAETIKQDAPDQSAAAFDRPAAASSRADIAHLAYILWIERGHQHGHDAEDWIRAEQILHSRSDSRSYS